MNDWNWILDLLVTLIGSGVGVFLAFELEHRRRDTEAVRHYANTLNSIRADLANLRSLTKQTSERMTQSGAPWNLFPPDTPALDAALSNSAFYDRVPYGLVSCLIVVANLRRSLSGAFRNSQPPRDNESLRTQLDLLLRTVSYVQLLVDDAVKPLGKPIVRTSQDGVILDGLNQAIKGKTAENSPADTTGKNSES